MKKTTKILFTLWACLCMVTYSFTFSACKTQENDSFDYSSSSSNTPDNSINTGNSSTPNTPNTPPSNPNEGEDTPIFSEQLKGLDIRDCWDFHDGLATIRYLKGGTSHYALINTKGEILATNTEHQTNFTTIGKGYAFHKVNDSFILLNESGTKISEFNEFTEILASQDGLALVDNVVESITGTKHFLGILDYTGKWLYPLTEFDVPVSGASFVSNEILLLSLKSPTRDGDYYLHFNTKTNKSVYLNNISYVFSTYDIANGFVIFSALADSIISTSYNSIDGTTLQKDSVYSLSPDGVYKKEATKEELLSHYDGYGDSKIILNKSTHIEILDVSTQKTIIYNDYEASLVTNILFYDDYGVVQMKRTDGTNFFTIINEDGKELFSPIVYYIGMGIGDPYYSEGFVTYSTAQQKFSICDLQGNVIPITAEHHYRSTVGGDGRFHNGYAVFQYVKAAGLRDFYINTKGERVLF